MFVLQKKNKSGVINVQVVSKATVVYKGAKTTGSSADVLKIKQLVAPMADFGHKTNVGFKL